MTASLIASPQAFSETVSGIVTREDAGFAEGVRVQVEGTNVETFTDRNGRYTLRGLDAGQYQVVFKFLGYADVTKTVTVKAGEDLNLDATIENDFEEAIVVYGTVSASNVELASLGRKSVILAEKIGQFPDFNAAEAVQRLTGVNVDNDRGEGRFVSVRGLPSSFNRVKVNGLSLGSPQSDGLSVPLDVFPASQLDKIEVTKSATPANDADFIGAEINLGFPTAFGNDPRTSFEISGGQTELESGDRYGFSALHSQTFGDDKFGITVSAQFNKRDIKAETIESEDWDEYDLDDSDEIDGTEVNQWLVDETQLRDMVVERENQGISAVFEWKPMESTRLYLSASINRFDEVEYRNRLETHFDSGSDEDVTPITVVDAGDGSTTVLDGEFVGVDRVDRDFTKDVTPEEFKIFSIGGETNWDEWYLEYQFGRSETEEKRKREEVEFRDEDSEFTAIYRSSGNVLKPGIEYGAGSGVFDPTAFAFEDIEYRENFRIDTVDTLSLDVTRFFILYDAELDVQFGFRYTSRERTRDLLNEQYESTADLTLADFAGSEIGSIVDNTYNFGPSIDRSAFDQIRSRSDLEDDSNDNHEIINDYKAEQDVLAYYLQATYQWSDFTVLAGVRIEETDFEIEAYSNVNDEVLDLEDEAVLETFKDDYSNTFPALHFRWDITDDLIFRSAWTNTMRRPSFTALNPQREIDVEVDEDTSEVVTEIEQGNPELKPFESENIDLSLDWYSDEYGAFSIAYFHKDIENFITEIEEEFAEFGGYINVTRERPINLQDGNVDGFEFSWNKQFQNGIGIELNHTIADSEVDFPAPGEDGARSGGETSVALEGQADETTNLSLIYSRDKFYARLSYKTTSSFIDEYGDTFLDVYQDRRQNIDFKTSYRINEMFKVEFLARNLGDEPRADFVGDSRTRLREFELNGPWYQLSLKVNLDH